MNQQRAIVDALLRAAPNNDHAPVRQRRARFAEAQSKPLPADVTATQVSLGGRPALDPVPRGMADDSCPVLLYFSAGITWPAPRAADAMLDLAVGESDCAQRSD